jgi:hypothetical protein
MNYRLQMLGKHVTVCIDGIVMDEKGWLDNQGCFMSLAYRCVYGFWELEKI